jgi:hypothetical protein
MHSGTDTLDPIKALSCLRISTVVMYRHRIMVMVTEVFLQILQRTFAFISITLPTALSLTEHLLNILATNTESKEGTQSPVSHLWCGVLDSCEL